MLAVTILDSISGMPAQLCALRRRQVVGRRAAGRQPAPSGRCRVVPEALICFQTTPTPALSLSASADEDFSPSAPGEDSPSTGPSLPALSCPHQSICRSASLHHCSFPLFQSCCHLFIVGSARIPRQINLARQVVAQDWGVDGLSWAPVPAWCRAGTVLLSCTVPWCEQH